MNRSIPKRHHFVPEMLQKRFISEQGGLWTYDSRRPISQSLNAMSHPWGGFVERVLRCLDHQ